MDVEPPGELRKARETAGLTLDQVAVRAGTTRSNLSRIERGQRVPSAALLARVTHVITEAIAAKRVA